MIWLEFRADAAERYGARVEPVFRRTEWVHDTEYAIWSWPTPEWAKRGEALVHRAWSELIPNVPWAAVAGGGFYPNGRDL